MREKIQNLHEQFGFRPVISGVFPPFQARTVGRLDGLIPPRIGPPELLMEAAPQESNRLYRHIIIAGMGGSGLAGALLKNHYHDLDIIVHRNYGLPFLPSEELAYSLVIASSYSGNTEETIDAFQRALELGIPTIAIATGGKLLEMAKERDIPFIKIPTTSIQPRLALGYSVAAILKAMDKENDLPLLYALKERLRPADFEEDGKTLATELHNRIPVIYGSTANKMIAYIWKINFNETGKIPAFCNVFPELNHNEMTGFDIQPKTRALSEQFTIILLRDSDDDPRIQKRMNILEKMLSKRGLRIRNVSLVGKNFFEKVFSSIMISEWAAYHIGTNYGGEVEHIPMVDELKKLMAK